MTKLEVINTALLGVSEEGLSSLSEKHPASLAAIAAYDLALTTLISRHPWSFLITDATLTSEPSESDVYYYKFLIPKNFERLLTVYSNPVNVIDVLTNSVFETPLTLNFYQVRGRYIHSNYATIQLVYLRNDLENVISSSGFLTTLIKFIQKELAISRKNSPTLYNLYKDTSETELRFALTQDLQQTKNYTANSLDTVAERNFKAGYRRS